MRYLAFIIAAITSVEVQAFQLVPRLVVNITIDQLRTDYMEAFFDFYSEYGFKRLLNEGLYYDHASYPFRPVDRSSAIASLSTGSTPFYNGIIGNSWLDRETLLPVLSTDDKEYQNSPTLLKSSTLSDELKVSTDGKAKVYSFAAHKDAAILCSGHSADGVFWINGKRWESSGYYHLSFPKWLKTYNQQSFRSNTYKTTEQTNDHVVDVTLQALAHTELGEDDTTDLIYVTLSATKADDDKDAKIEKTEIKDIYQQLDLSLGRLINGIEKHIGTGQTLFVITSTGYFDEQTSNLSKYGIPTGTFYINRTASLLNMYLGAIYGSGRYVEQCYNNQIYLNRQLIEQKRISLSELLKRSCSFLLQNAGVADVYTSERLLSDGDDIRRTRAGFNSTTSGDIIVEVAPGWTLLNEDTQQSYTSRIGDISFPVIFWGCHIPHEHISSPITTDRIAATLAKAIRIRAPNACAAIPLF